MVRSNVRHCRAKGSNKRTCRTDKQRRENMLRLERKFKMPQRPMVWNGLMLVASYWPLGVNTRILVCTRKNRVNQSYWICPCDSPSGWEFEKQILVKICPCASPSGWEFEIGKLKHKLPRRWRRRSERWSQRWRKILQGPAKITATNRMYRKNRAGNYIYVRKVYQVSSQQFLARLW